MKPYHRIPIQDCREALVPIPPDVFARETPHPYAKLGAPYGNKSPFYLRQGVLDRLITAQTLLQCQHPGWRIQIFDAYRPLAVQQFMVDYTLAETVRAQGLTLEQLSEEQRSHVLQQVYQFWAVPNPNPATPPPHSTGAAVDITLVDATEQVVDMGSPIDELSPRSYPNFFAEEGAIAHPLSATFHTNRQRLRTIMLEAGFCQHPNEWWHFSFGDQMWVWLMQQADPSSSATARYGAVEHIAPGAFR
ncbi:MAG TPA: M15 family metallopeptidase [Crinalium sp.]